MHFPDALTHHYRYFIRDCPRVRISEVEVNASRKVLTLPLCKTGQHTGLTDLPLTERGEQIAGRLGNRLSELTFARVFTSPLQRARRTCELAGFGLVAEMDADLVEWDYGEYEGRRGVEIRAERSDWQLFRDGCPGPLFVYGTKLVT